MVKCDYLSSSLYIIHKLKKASSGVLVAIKEASLYSFYFLIIEGYLNRIGDVFDCDFF